MCAFDYQLYSDTRRIREKMSLVCVSTHDKTFFCSFVRTYVRSLVGWLDAWLVRWLAVVDCCCIVSTKKEKSRNESRSVRSVRVCMCVCVWNDSCRSRSWCCGAIERDGKEEEESDRVQTLKILRRSLVFASHPISFPLIRIFFASLCYLPATLHFNQQEIFIRFSVVCVCAFICEQTHVRLRVCMCVHSLSNSMGVCLCIQASLCVRWMIVSTEYVLLVFISFSILKI